MAKIEILPGEFVDITPTEYCERCEKLKKVLMRLIDTYIVADEYSGDEMAENVNQAFCRLMQKHEE